MRNKARLLAYRNVREWLGGKPFAGMMGMTKSLEVIGEAVRDSKHVFHKLENQPNKPQKHRYERRKVRGYLQIAGRRGIE